MFPRHSVLVLNEAGGAEGAMSRPFNASQSAGEPLALQEHTSHSKQTMGVPGQRQGRGSQRSPWLKVCEFSKGCALEAKCCVRRG